MFIKSQINDTHENFDGTLGIKQSCGSDDSGNSLAPNRFKRISSVCIYTFYEACTYEGFHSNY